MLPCPSDVDDVWSSRAGEGRDEKEERECDDMGRVRIEDLWTVDPSRRAARGGSEGGVGSSRRRIDNDNCGEERERYLAGICGTGGMCSLWNGMYGCEEPEHGWLKMSDDGLGDLDSICKKEELP